MAFAWIFYNGDKAPLLKNALLEAEGNRDRFFNPRASIFNIRDMMIQMRDGNGSVDTHYAQVTSRFGFVNDASAKAAFDEIASACGIMENASSTATQINAALTQLFAKLRG